MKTLYMLPMLLAAGCASHQKSETAAGQQQQAQAARTSTQVPRQADDPSAVQAPGYDEVSIPAGTVFHVRLDEAVDTSRNRAGDHFSATLVNAIEIHGTMFVPAGTVCRGHLIESKPSGRFKGRAVLSLALDTFDLNGRRYEIKTAPLLRESRGHKKRNWVWIGGGSGVGAAFGALAGAPAALIGAGAGAAAGATGAAITGKKSVRLPAETKLAFTLRSPAAVSFQNRGESL